MPKLFRLGCFSVYFWSNENKEPIHVHIGIGNPYSNATKIWLTKNKKCKIAHNKSRISQNDLNEIIDAIHANHDLICEKWKSYFDVENIEFYC